MLPVVLLTDPIESEAIHLLRVHAQVVLAQSVCAADLVAAASEASVVIVRSPLPEELLDCSKRLLGVVRHGAGLDMIPVERADSLGIAVANVPAVNAESVAEFAVGQMIELSRRNHRMHRALLDSGWAPAREMASTSHELKGRSIAIVGTGAVGSKLAEICSRGFQMEVLAINRSGSGSLPGVRYTTLADALPQADFLVLACPLNDSTRGLIDEAAFAMLKPGAFLINVARGPVVMESALVAALEEGRLAGAALDVFEQQPLPADSALRRLPNVLLSPHAAGITVESMRQMSAGAVEATISMLRRELPANLVNRAHTDRIRARWARIPSIP